MTTTHILGDPVPRKSNIDPLLAEKLTRYYAEHPEELEVSLAPTSSASYTSSLLEMITGNYLKVIQAVVPETIQTSAELQKARVELDAQKDNPLKDGFYTASVTLYGIENGKSFLLFGDREAFLRLYVTHINDVYTHISNQQHYILPSADKAWALEEGISSGALTRFNLAELIETKLDDESGYFTIYTNNATQLTPTKRKLAELIHGQGNDYFECMQMLAGRAIPKTKIYLLNPDFVESVKSITGNNLIGRAAWLNNFGNSSNFNTSVCTFKSAVRLRGVRKE